jgi:hypothetical protein
MRSKPATESIDGTQHWQVQAVVQGVFSNSKFFHPVTSNI